MHEVGICQSILKAVEEELTPEQMQYLHEVHVKIGILSGVEPDFLEHAFKFVKAGSAFEDVKLQVERIEAVAHCATCDAPFKVDRYQFLCPQCGDPASKILSGNELEISKLILEVEEESSDEEAHEQGSRNAPGP